MNNPALHRSHRRRHAPGRHRPRLLRAQGRATPAAHRARRGRLPVGRRRQALPGRHRRRGGRQHRPRQPARAGRDDRAGRQGQLRLPALLRERAQHRAGRPRLRAGGRGLRSRLLRLGRLGGQRVGHQAGAPVRGGHGAGQPQQGDLARPQLPRLHAGRARGHRRRQHAGAVRPDDPHDAEGAGAAVLPRAGRPHGGVATRWPAPTHSSRPSCAKARETVLAFILEPIGGLSTGAVVSSAGVLRARARDLRPPWRAADLRRDHERRRPHRRLPRRAPLGRRAARPGHAGQGAGRRLHAAGLPARARPHRRCGGRQRRLRARPYLLHQSAVLRGRPCGGRRGGPQHLVARGARPGRAAHGAAARDRRRARRSSATCAARAC